MKNVTEYFYRNFVILLEISLLFQISKFQIFQNLACGGMLVLLMQCYLNQFHPPGSFGFPTILLKDQSYFTFDNI